MHSPHVLVAGACGGIGRATALQQAAWGARLVLTDLDATALHALAGQCRDVGADDVNVHLADVTDAESLGQAVRAALEHTPRLDGLVYATGITGPVAPLGEYPAESFERVLGVNLLGLFHLLTAALPALRRAEAASVVAVGSTSAIRGRSLLAGYVASKHGLLGLVRTASLELADTAIRVNAVLPGPVDTPMLDALNQAATSHADDPDDAFGRAAGQVATPDDIAQTISFLLSARSKHVRGAAWVVDGGATVG